MPNPDPEVLVLFAQIVGVGIAVGTPVWGVYSWIHGRLDKKADKDEVERHRDYFVKVFDKLEEHQKSDNAQFQKVLETMNHHHAEVLRELGNKADR